MRSRSERAPRLRLSRPRSAARLAVLVPIAVALGLLAGCPPPAPVAAAPELREYGPEDATLLDDTFGPGVFPVSALVMSGTESKLVERVVQAECVLPVEIITVSRQGVVPSLTYALVVTPTGEALTGTHWTEPITLTVAPTSPSYAQIASADTTLVGTPLIIFFRRYYAGGIEQIHWRAESDTPAIRAAILRATGVRAGREHHEPR